MATRRCDELVRLFWQEAGAEEDIVFLNGGESKNKNFCVVENQCMRRGKDEVVF
jgi:hypothetical protein